VSTTQFLSRKSSLTAIRISQQRINIFSQTKCGITSENNKLYAYSSFKESDGVFFTVIVSLKLDFNSLQISKGYSKKSSALRWLKKSVSVWNNVKLHILEFH
jgi:hypothetical protein